MPDLISRTIDKFIERIPDLVIALLIFIVSIYLARLIANLFRKVLRRNRAPEGVTHLLGELVQWSIVVMGAITAIQRFFNVTAFLTGLGIVGFTIGFALQDVMKNFASGILLLIQQPFHVGEVISAAGFDGTIQQIDLRTTQMETVDGRIVILPNANILSGPIINFTRARRLRVGFNLSLPHTIDPDHIRQLVREAIQKVPGFVAEPTPLIVFDGLTSSSLDLRVNFWINTAENKLLSAKDMAILNVVKALENQGVEIPHPVQRVIGENN